MVEVAAHCRVCDRVTTHRGDNAGTLHCMPCLLTNSLPPTSDVTPDQTPVVAMPDEPRRRSKAEIIAAIVTVAVVGFLVYAFIRGV